MGLLNRWLERNTGRLVMPGCQIKIKASRRRRYLLNKEKINARHRAYYAANPEHARLTRKKSRDKHLDSTRASRRKWRINNPGHVNALTASYRADKLKATPTWLTKEQMDEIKQLYILAKELQWLSETPLEVDHEVPLRGENVSGLHVPWNLRIVPMPVNRSKSNKVLQR